MLEVWGRRNSSNVIPVMWAIGELGVPHVRHDVGGSFGGVDTAEYLALNPNGRIPTIRDGDLVLSESNAVVRYLSRRYGAGSLLPDSVDDQARADQWMDWHKAAPYPPMIDLFWALVRTEPAMRDSHAVGRLSRVLGDTLQILETHMAGRAFVLGDGLTMADIPLGALAYRYFQMDVARPDLPNFTAWYQRLCERPAFREHAMIPFGSNPAEWYMLERGISDESPT